MNLVEKVGSGLKRIRDMCVAHPCASPEIEADQDWYKIVFYRPGAKAIPEVTPEVTPEARLLKVVTGNRRLHGRAYRSAPAKTGAVWMNCCASQQN